MLPLIEAVEVSKRYAGRLEREGTLALAGLFLTIDVDAPSVTAVVGESGSGKTTLAPLLLGLTVYVHLSRLDLPQRRRPRIHSR
jgi:ABC-type glutathione transport system ATPase component